MFTTAVETGGRGRVLLTPPFDPDALWGTKSRHPVTGTIDGVGVRGNLQRHGDAWALLLGLAWVRDHPVVIGHVVDVSLTPEVPQQDELDPDVATALRETPEAAAFFDSLAQFYRRAYLRWVDGTTRRPEERQRRITSMVALLARGEKDYRGAEAPRRPDQ